MKKIAFILYTNGLQFDDRSRKVVQSLIDRNFEVEIFYITPDNIDLNSVTSYGVFSSQISLWLRNVLPHNSFALLKGIEMYFKFKKHTKKFDIIWINDIEPMFFLLLSRKFLVWDLHEVPSFFQKNLFTKLLFHYFEKRCEFIFHANNQRKEFLIEVGLIKKENKHNIIRNFPDQLFLNSTYTDLKFDDFYIWLGDDDFIYLQGLDSFSRYPLQTIEAIMKFGRMKAIVVGHFDELLKQKLIDKFGCRLLKTIFFVGKIDQLSLPTLMKKSKFSMIFYSDINANNLYCEPNRLFQYLIFNKPVIIGNNPSMVDIVDKYGFGFCLKSFGQDVDEIVEAIDDVLLNYHYYVQNIKSNNKVLFWENQYSVFDNVINSMNQIDI